MSLATCFRDNVIVTTSPEARIALITCSGEASGRQGQLSGAAEGMRGRAGEEGGGGRGVSKLPVPHGDWRQTSSYETHDLPLTARIMSPTFSLPSFPATPSGEMNPIVAPLR